MNVIINSLTYIVWFLSTYFVILLLLSVFSNRRRLFESTDKLKFFPFVTVIVPAFNEEETISSTIASLKQVNYPQDKIEYIFVNDGSRDSTSDRVHSAINGDVRFRFIDRKENKGKAFSLNEGISHAKGEFVACMDADSVVEPDIFQKALPYFSSDDSSDNIEEFEKPSGISQTPHKSALNTDAKKDYSKPSKDFKGSVIE